MDEERRTSINLKECIRADNQELLLLTQDFWIELEMKSILASSGLFMKKNDMKNAPWISSYEKRNVSIGLECGLKGKAQIAKECGQCQI